ncbi:MAG: NAD-glutamate dehydrogenase domain-containing protein [Pedobacter sp.]
MTADTTASTQSDPSQLLSRKALQLLASRHDPESLETMVLLAEKLTEHAAPTAFSLMTPEELAQLLEYLMFAVEGRGDKQGVSVGLFPLPKAGRFWLIACAADVPYLFDAVIGLVKQRVLRFRVVAHPILGARDRQGRRTLVRTGRNVTRLSMMIFELQSFLPEVDPDLVDDVRHLVKGMEQLAQDQPAMGRCIGQLQDLATADGYGAFWRWLQAGNFELVAYRCIDIRLREDGELVLFQKHDAAIGFIPGNWEVFPETGQCLCEMPAPFRQRMLRHETVTVVPGDQPCPVRPEEQLLFLALRENIDPELCREHVFAGMLTAQGRVQGNISLPPLRRRIQQVLHSLGIRAHSHDWRKTMEMLDGFPTIELFLIQRVELTRIVRALTQLYRDGSVKVVTVPGLAAGWLTLVVMLPRRFYSPDNLHRMELHLRRYLQTDQLSVHIGQGGGDTVTLQVRCPFAPGHDQIDTVRLERVLTRIGRSWEEKCGLLLEKLHGPAEGARLTTRYLPVLSREYRALVHPRFAVRDIEALDTLLQKGLETFALWGPLPGQGGQYLLQYYGMQALPLGQIMPVLEDLGLEVQTNVDFEIGDEAARCFIHSIAVRLPTSHPDSASVKGLLLDALSAIRAGRTESDSLNRLVTTAAMSWRQISVLRAYRAYLLQLGQPYGHGEVGRALVSDIAVAKLLYDYFEARFQGSGEASALRNKEEKLLPPLRHAMVEALNSVTDLRQDTILRTLFNLVDATLRTNYYLCEDTPGHPLSFKIASMGIIDLPAPRPLYEIFVHSPSMMGIHLRGGKVARGGIRWCDRPEGMRDEVLDLMSTQMIKNTLIVPVGSKGGFVVKNLSVKLETAQAQVAKAYEDFMRGMLDLTDNLVDGAPRRVPQLVAYDDQDSYLVVAADKGTARFSDRANAVSAEYRFWLGDAFASGGSQGYDHKKLGITARGAWVSVQRHFRELDTSYADKGLTVIGIGDMSGDVFGNGLLQSDKLRLLAAFDHRHIFLDPDPDPVVSFAERRRLFELPRSSWADYAPRLISAGGGVFPRDAKDIPLSPEVRSWLGTHQRSSDGPGLVRLILSAPADLLWNGGIGTYIKADGETHQQVGDRPNDNVRIDARQLKVKVVGEGGNLGFTQRARVEYSLCGGRINVDAVDNAGGVACSDHEVNLKILMRQLIDAGQLATLEERDRLLESLGEEICQAVLDDCGKQGLCLSLDRARCADRLESFFAQMESLSNAGFLDPAAHDLPGLKQTMARPERALARPELAVLMAYSKMQMYHALLQSDLPESYFGHSCLHDYFPARLVEKFGHTFSAHPLAREIAATVMSNRIINQAGSAMCGRLCRQTGAELSEVAALYLLFDEVLDGPRMRRLVTSKSLQWSADRELQWLLRLEKTLEEMCRWALVRNLGIPLQPAVVEAFHRDISSYLVILDTVLPHDVRQSLSNQAFALAQDGFDEFSAKKCVALNYLEDFLPVANLALLTGEDLLTMARLLSEVKQQLGLPAIIESLAQVQSLERWDRLAWQSLHSKFGSLGFDVALAVWRESQGDCQRYLSMRGSRMRVLRDQQARLQGSIPADYHPFVVVMATLESLLGGGDREKSGQYP